MDSNQPPTKIPIAKPKGVPNPRHPKAMFLALPLGKAALNMLTEVGKHMEMPIPWNARNIIKWRPDLARPAARMNTLEPRVPTRLMVLLPTKSATAPKRRSVHPQVSLKSVLSADFIACDDAVCCDFRLTSKSKRAYARETLGLGFDENMKTNHRSRLRDIYRSSPILGSRTVNMPVFMAPTVTVAFNEQIRTTVRLLDKFTGAVLSDEGSLLMEDDVLTGRTGGDIFFVVSATLSNIMARNESTGN